MNRHMDRLKEFYNLKKIVKIKEFFTVYLLTIITTCIVYFLQILCA